ncbi:MAG TPA: CAP domain-containing protein [bacterium]|nr:CAP domain-containing protein [bacterium]
MIHRALQLALFTLLTAAAVTAQGDEAQFNARQAKALNKFAKKAFGKGFPRIAKVVWLKTIKLYDPDNQEAWTSLGYVKNGSSWVLDTNRPYPTKDTGKGSDGKPLQAQYRALEKTLAKQHKAMAKKYEKADRRDRALHHWRMVLRWVKEDHEASKALAHREFGGLSGTDLEKTLYERSKKIEKAVEEQAQTEYETETVSGIECQPLVRAQVPYITVKSEHFVLHGDAEEEQNLHEALQWAERTLRVCEAAFPWQIPTRWTAQWAYFTSDDLYKQILKANQVPDLAWKLENSKTSTVGNTRVGATSGKQVLLDACVRNVAQGCAGLGSTAFSEGIGHTFVGMIFNNNRLFAVDLKRQQGTTASEEDREFQSPDFDVWKNLSLEMAWKSTGGVPANALPFCQASDFTNEQRIKSWSFCDYMVRRDPKMLRTMDRIALELQKKRIRQPQEFERLFHEAHPDVTIAQLDKEWEDFWTEASPVLKAIRDNTPPVSAISKGVDKWLAALNERRTSLGRTPVTWSATFSTRCKAHAEYLAANKDQRGPAAEHTEKVDLGGSYTNSLFAQMAIVETNTPPSKAKKAFDRWIYWPGYRDLLLNNMILSVGMYVDGNIVVINATSGLGSPEKEHAGINSFPKPHDTGEIFRREVPVAELGPEIAELLAKHGRAGQKTIGFPLTLHSAGLSGVGVRGTLQCAVMTDKKEKIEGVLVFDGNCRRSAAPGMATFWPLDPLPKGKIHWTWTWMGGSSQQRVSGAFAAK